MFVVRFATGGSLKDKSESDEKAEGGGVTPAKGMKPR